MDAGFQQYSALVATTPGNGSKNFPAHRAEGGGSRGRMLPAVPSPSPSPFRPIQSPVRQASSNKNTTSSTPPTYRPTASKTNQPILSYDNITNTISEGNQHNYVNFTSEQQHTQQPAYANITTIPISSGTSRPNSTTSFAEIQQAKQKQQQQLEQQKRRESTGSGRLLVENTTSSRLVSNAMNGMMQNNVTMATVNGIANGSTHIRPRSSSQASLTSSSTTGK